MPSTNQLNQPYFDRVSDPVLIIDHEGYIQYANPAFLESYGDMI